MKFQTPVTDYGNTFKIAPKDKILALGSCFASVVGKRLSDNQMKIILNPFGTLYNPKSIFDVLLLCLDWAEGKVDPNLLCNEVIFESNHGVWYSWLSSSVIQGSTREECRTSFLQVLDKVASWLKELDVLMVTFGTMHYYSLKDDKQNLCVANCHKMPASFFDEKEMTAEEIVKRFNLVVSRMRCVSPNVKVVTSVSPYRYLKYGLHKNQASKATLFVALEQSMRESGNIFYFPAYEILNDELRDYRFYASDMVHPSSVAEDYIWDQFSRHYLDEQTLSFIEEWRPVVKMREHKPSSAAAAIHLDSIIKEKTDSLKLKYPSMFQL